MALVMKLLLPVLIVAFLSALAALQVEVSQLRSALTQAKSDVLRYDERLAAAVETLTKNVFGEEAVRANPLPVAFREPGRRCEGEIYRFGSLGNQLVKQLPHR